MGGEGREFIVYVYTGVSLSSNNPELLSLWVSTLTTLESFCSSMYHFDGSPFNSVYSGSLALTTSPVHHQQQHALVTYVTVFSFA